MSHRAVGRGGLLALLAIASGCGLPASMERAGPAGAPCPAERLARNTGAPADTTNVRWYRSGGRRDLQISGAWCETVGPPVFRMSPELDGPAWTPDSGLRVVSWNMELGGGDIYDLLATEVGLDCRAGARRMRTGAPPFVVLLQEAFRYSDDLPRVAEGDPIPWAIDPEREPTGHDDVVTVAERCGLAYLYVPSARNGPDDGPRPREDMGTAIYASVPFNAPVAFDLPVEGGRKVATGVTVTAPGGERVRLVSTHLDVASTLLRTMLSGNQTRVRQVTGVIEGVDQAERDGPLTQVVIVGGDFNTWAGNESALRLMRQEFPDSPPWDGVSTRGPFPPDHIFFRRGAFGRFDVEGYRRIDDAYGSDHHPRTLTVTYGPLPDGTGANAAERR